jgi:hypothetical protein
MTDDKKVAILPRAENNLCSLIAEQRDNFITVVFQKLGSFLQQVLVVSDLKHHPLPEPRCRPAYILEGHNLVGRRVNRQTLVGRSCCELSESPASALQAVHRSAPNHGMVLEPLEQIVVPLHGNLRPLSQGWQSVTQAFLVGFPLAGNPSPKVPGPRRLFKRGDDLFSVEAAVFDENFAGYLPAHDHARHVEAGNVGLQRVGIHCGFLCLRVELDSLPL